MLAFEMKAAKYLKDKYGSFVLEFDDWHFARGINAKAMLIGFMAKSFKFNSYSFSVNQYLDINKKYGIKSSLLPGTVNEEIIGLNIILAIYI